MKQFHKILVATDFSECSAEACEYAIMMAKKFDSSLVVMHVINEPVDLRGFYVPHVSFEQLESEIAESAKNMLDNFCREKLGDFSKYEALVVTGIPYEEILRTADEKSVSLIVIGTHGRTGLDHLIFGSTAERVIRSATSPVLTIRSQTGN